MKFEPGNKVPKKKYETPEQLQSAVDAYFLKMDNEERPYTVQGLTVALGFCEVKSLIDYAKGEGYEEFHDIMKIAKLKIETYKAEGLQDRGKSTIGIIFDLKNNFNWADKHEIEQTTSKDKEITEDQLSPELIKQILKTQSDAEAK